MADIFGGNFLDDRIVRHINTVIPIHKPVLKARQEGDDDDRRNQACGKYYFQIDFFSQFNQTPPRFNARVKTSIFLPQA